MIGKYLLSLCTYHKFKMFFPLYINMNCECEDNVTLVFVLEKIVEL